MSPITDQPAGTTAIQPFTAWQEPALFSTEVRAAFRSLR